MTLPLTGTGAGGGAVAAASAAGARPSGEGPVKSGLAVVTPKTPPMGPMRGLRETSPPGSPHAAERPAFSTNPSVNMTFHHRVHTVAAASNKLQETAYIGDKTSPGVFMVVSSEGKVDNQYVLVKVGNLGRSDSVNFEKTATGYTNGTKAPTFEKLIEHLCADVRDKLGAIIGIPYYSKTDANLIIETIRNATSPVYEIFQREGDNRLILAWTNGHGSFYSAHVHFNHELGVWQNGGPSPSLSPPVEAASSAAASHDPEPLSSPIAASPERKEPVAARKPSDPSFSTLHLDELVFGKILDRHALRLLYTAAG